MPSNRSRRDRTAEGRLQPVLLFFLVVLAVVRPARAQDSTTCYADGGYRLWPDAPWQSKQDTVSRSAEFVARTLAGRYRMVVIITEGPGLRKFGSEWDLTLEPTPADSARRWGRMHQGRADVFPLWGSRKLVRSGYLDEEMRLAHPDSAGQVVRVSYFGGERLTLQGGPFDVMDGGGGFFDVDEVDEPGGFRGRWVEGSLAIYVTPTPLGELGEASKGYFCAFRRSP